MFNLSSLAKCIINYNLTDKITAVYRCYYCMSPRHELWNFRSHVLLLPGTKVP